VAVRFLFAGVTTLAIVLALAPTELPAQGAGLRVVEVRVDGRVEPEGASVTALSASGGTPEPRRVQAGTEMPAGLELFVPGRTVLVLESANGTRIELAPGTRFKPGAVTDKGEAHVVNSGSVTFDVRRALNFFNVDFQRFVALVRGTAFTVIADESGAATATVSRGRVLVQRDVPTEIADRSSTADMLVVEALDVRGGRQRSWSASDRALSFSRYEDARRFYESQVVTADASGDYDERQVALNNLGIFWMTWGDPRLAIPPFRRCLEAAAARGDEPWRARALNNLGAAAYASGALADALVHVNDALATNLRLTPGGVSRRIAQNQNNLGLAHRKAGDVSQGVAWLEAALDTNRRLAPSGKSVAIAKNLDNLGNAWSSRDRARARDYYDEALRMRLDIYGAAAHPDLANSYANLGILHSQADDVPAALDFHRKALAIRRSLYAGRPHPSVADSYFNLGISYCRARRLKEGIAEHERALAMLKNLHPSGVDPSLVASYRGLAACWARGAPDPRAVKRAEHYARLAQQTEQRLQPKP
jgi:tetratricopeptide (TPR) repeat protein